MATNSPPEQFSDNNQETLSDLASLVAGLDMAIHYQNHPDEDILRAYVYNRLSDDPKRFSATFGDGQAFQKFLQGRLLRWTHSDVSLHILTCLQCQQRVAYLRESRWRSWVLARTQRAPEWSWGRRFALGALAGAAAAAIIATLWLRPPTPCQIDQPCWQQVVQKEMKGGIMVLYQTPGRF